MPAKTQRHPRAVSQPQARPTRKNGKLSSLRKRQRKSKNKPAACQTGIHRRRNKRWPSNFR